MARHNFCSKCGMKLSLRLKALPHKNLVVQLVDPHECLESDEFLSNITDSDSSAIPMADKPITEDQEPDPLSTFFNGSGEPGDKRKEDQLRKTTAPKGLISTFDNLTNSVPVADIGED